MKRWLRRFLQALGLVPALEQRTGCWCPACRNELVGDEDTTYRYDETGCVVYRCGACGAESRWLFDAPVPILLEPHESDRVFGGRLPP